LRGACAQWALSGPRAPLLNPFLHPPLPTSLSQGKTSRWAIAWSFTVDPNTARVPLRSHAPGAAAAAAAAAAEVAAAEAAVAAAAAAAALPPPRRAVRMTSFTLLAPAAEGRRLLQAVAALLGREGAACRVDAGAWAVHATLPLQAAAAVAGGAPPPSKRARMEGGGSGGDSEDDGAGAAGLGVRVSVSQQARGSFTVAASIPNHSSDLAARRFTDAMHAVKDDLALMWRLKPQ
jgi:hypothetical protein